MLPIEAQTQPQVRQDASLLGYRPELDGIRGVAILLVVALHVGGAGHRWLGGGDMGVDLFFVLSGFLITTLLLEERDTVGGISIRAFYGRRVRRLAPALVALVAIAASATVATGKMTIGDAAAFAVIRLTYFSNLLSAFSPGSVGPGFSHLWSLAQEEQFYVVWPPALSVLLAWRRSSRAILSVLAILIVAVNVQRCLVVADGGSWQRVWYSPDTHLDPILFGCAAAVVRFHDLARPSRRVVAISLVASAAVVIAFRPLMTWEHPIAIPIFAGAASVLVLAAINGALFPTLARTLSWGPLRGLGKISYSLYLWHVPLIAAFGMPGAVAAFGVATLSYRYIERPFRRPRPGSSQASPSSPELEPQLAS